MSLNAKIKNHKNIAVFTRNHRKYIEEAVARNLVRPERYTTFRSAVKWTSAHFARVDRKKMAVRRNSKSMVVTGCPKASCRYVPKCVPPRRCWVATVTSSPTFTGSASRCAAKARKSGGGEQPMANPASNPMPGHPMKKRSNHRETTHRILRFVDRGNRCVWLQGALAGSAIPRWQVRRQA